MYQETFYLLLRNECLKITRRMAEVNRRESSDVSQPEVENAYVDFLFCFLPLSLSQYYDFSQTAVD